MHDLCPLNQFGFLKVQGVDAISFLQGYTTNDLTLLGEGNVQLGAICNIQGRMLASFLVIRDGQDLMLRMSRDLVEITKAFLAKYIVFSKAELVDMSEDFVCFGSLGADGNFTYRKTDTGWVISLGNRAEHWHSVSDRVIAESDPGQFANAEFEAGIAWVTAATSETFLPQMFNYHQLSGIDFEKGCYLGQEIIARAQYRGELKRRLHRLPPVNGIEVGEKTGSQGMIVAVTDAGMLAILQNPQEDIISITVGDIQLQAEIC
jgi:folate-binding protein YgfZ